MSAIFEPLAQDDELLAQELEMAMAHAKTASEHAEAKEISRVCAHARLNQRAQLHAEKARPE